MVHYFTRNILAQRYWEMVFFAILCNTSVNNCEQNVTFVVMFASLNLQCHRFFRNIAAIFSVSYTKVKRGISDSCSDYGLVCETAIMKFQISCEFCTENIHPRKCPSVPMPWHLESIHRKELLLRIMNKFILCNRTEPKFWVYHQSYVLQVEKITILELFFCVWTPFFQKSCFNYKENKPHFLLPFVK